MKREIIFNAWIPELEFMLEGVAIGYGSISFWGGDNEDKDFISFKKALKVKGFDADEYELPEWISENDDWYSIDEGHYELLQFSGQISVCAKQIFEGNIVRVAGDEIGTIIPADFTGQVKFIEGAWYVDNDRTAFMLWQEIAQWEVIGTGFSKMGAPEPSTIL